MALDALTIACRFDCMVLDALTIACRFDCMALDALTIGCRLPGLLSPLHLLIQDVFTDLRQLVLTFK